MSLSSPASAPRYEVADHPTLRLADIVLRWETILVLLLIAVVVFNASISPYFLDFYNLSDATFNFSEKGILALAMAFLIIIGEIDLSIAAIIAVASLAMGLAAQAGAPTTAPGAPPVAGPTGPRGAPPGMPPGMYMGPNGPQFGPGPTGMPPGVPLWMMSWISAAERVRSRRLRARGSPRSVPVASSP